MDFRNTPRYSITEQEAYEPGSDNQVLKNFLGIKEKELMDQLEARELIRTEKEIFSMYHANYSFNAQDICSMHKLWLKNIYSFAGKYRTVNMSKDGFPFAGAPYISSCMEKFEKDCLAKYTPCHNSNFSELALALGVTHIEFILIHPFREGNGRIARMLATLMGLQANQPPLDFELIDQTIYPQGFKNYIAAIHAGHAGNYQPIQDIFLMILNFSNQ